MRIYLLMLIMALPPGEVLLSGVAVGKRPGPYSSVVAVGPQRGTSHCFICETADRPAVIVFARRPTDALARLVRGMDQAVLQDKSTNLRAWVTFLSDDQPALDPVLVRWSRDQGITAVPLGIFEDPAGPPSYKLHADAEVTVMLSVQQKVRRNFAFRAGELNETGIKEILAAMAELAK